MEIKLQGSSVYRIKGKTATVLIDPQKIVVEDFVIDGPGEYEIKGTNIFGVRDEEKNNIYEIRLDGLVLLYGNNLTHKLSDKQAAVFDSVDILLLTVDGQNEVIAQLEPKIVVTNKNPGNTEVTPQDKLSITKDKLPETTQFVVLK